MRLIIALLVLIDVAALISLKVGLTTDIEMLSLLYVDVPEGGDSVGELQKEAVQLRMQVTEGQYHYKARQRLETKINWIVGLLIVNGFVLIFLLAGLPRTSIGNDTNAANSEQPQGPASPDQLR